MAVIELTDKTFDQTVSGTDIVLIDWWASWCGPCRAFAPVFEAAAQQRDDVVFAKVDTEANPELSARAGIRSIPTLMAFRENVLVYTQPGALSAASLQTLIDQVHALDMSEVHRLVSPEVATSS